MSYSWLRAWRVGPLVLSVIACGSDQGPTNHGATCGEGTELQNGKCIPQCGAGTVLQGGQCVGAGAGGNASQGGGENRSGSAGSDDADSGNGGESESDAGSAGESENGGSDGLGGGAGSNFGGNGGSAGLGFGGNAGTAGSGLAGSGGVGPRPQWLAITQADGLFAYDLSKYPASLVSLDSKTLRAPSWSPDGHWLLYQKSPEVYCRDMTTAAPGAPVFVASAEAINNQVFDSISWSADSKSAALAIAPVTPANSPFTLQVFDPTQAVPSLSTLSNAARTVRWAPTGDRIMYSEDGVIRVRRVRSGAPDPAVALDGSGNDYSWSPDGNAVAYDTSTALYLVDLTQTAPSPITLTNPSVATPTLDQARFSADGTSLLFTGAQVRDGAQDLFKVALKPTIGAPVRLSTGITGTASVIGFWISPDDKWAIYTVSEAAKPATNWAVNLSGTNPGTPFQLGTPSIVGGVWVPNGSGNLLTSSSAGITITDVPNATTSQLSGVSGSTNFSLAPVGAVLAYGANPVASHLFVRDLTHLENPAADIPFLLSSGARSWQWSPDGKFIATVEGVSNYQLRLIRLLDGITPSIAMAVSTSSSTPGFFWQPVSH